MSITLHDAAVVSEAASRIGEAASRYAEHFGGITIGNLDELRYEGGYPTAESIRKLYYQLDLQRAAQAYLDFMPAMSMQALLDAHPRDFGVSETGGMIVYVEPGEGKSIAIGLTYNTESV